MAAPMARLLNWARAKSLWILPFGECACTDERTAACAAPGDLERWGARGFSPEPEQADMLLIGGRVALKMLPVLQQTYARMPEPKWVIALGACACATAHFPGPTGQLSRHLRSGRGARPFGAGRYLCVGVPAAPRRSHRRDRKPAARHRPQRLKALPFRYPGCAGLAIFDR